MRNFFNNRLEQVDHEIYKLIEEENKRHQQEIDLIASENLVSQAVLDAQGSILTNKYAEGYPGKRYYGGCCVVDKIEQLAIDRAKELFKCNFANVQPHSGSQMNQAVFMALLKPGDSFMGMNLSAGGHLTHGSSVNMSGKWFNPIFYGVSEETNLIDMDNVAQIARQYRPKLIIAGATAYSREIDWKAFREICDEIGAYLMTDVSHIAGLIAGGVHSSPLPYAHVVTTTTHKSLRGPRGGLILTNDEQIAHKIDKAVFPGLQGGPLMHVIAAKAVAFGEALNPSFCEYAKQIVLGAKALANSLMANNIDVITHGTDNHLVLVDLRSKGLTGKVIEESLGRAHIICNKNTVPFDQASPFITSGIRLGTPSSTTRGFREKEFDQVGNMISSIIEAHAKNHNIVEMENEIKKEALELTASMPLY